MAEYDTSTANYGRADKSFAAPDLARHAGPDAGAVASAKLLRQDGKQWKLVKNFPEIRT
jgi:hypothetical protein